MAHTITLAVVPEPNTRGTEVVIGEVQYTDPHPFLYTFLWSVDETIIAVLSNISIEEIEKDPYTGLCYTYAYDFLKNRVIKPPPRDTKADDPNILNKNAIQIKSLLEERGRCRKNHRFSANAFQATQPQRKQSLEECIEKGKR
jgi:hypothetical protein